MMNQKTAQEIITAEQTLAAAHTEMNLQLIDQLLHEQYVVVQPNGRLETKQEVLHSYQHEQREWHTAAVDQLDVRLYNENQTAVAIGRWQATGRNNGQPFDYAARFLSVWVRQDGRWQNVAYQAAEIPNQSTLFSKTID